MRDSTINWSAEEGRLEFDKSKEAAMRGQKEISSI